MRGCQVKKIRAALSVVLMVLAILVIFKVSDALFPVMLVVFSLVLLMAGLEDLKLKKKPVSAIVNWGVSIFIVIVAVRMWIVG